MITQERYEAHHPGGMIRGMIYGSKVGMMDGSLGRTTEE